MIASVNHAFQRLPKKPNESPGRGLITPLSQSDSVPALPARPITLLMDIVLAVLIAYALGGSIWPHIVRDRRFFLIGAGVVVLAIVLSPTHFSMRLAEAAAFVLFMLASSGESLQQWRSQVLG